MTVGKRPWLLFTACLASLFLHGCAVAGTQQYPCLDRPCNLPSPAPGPVLPQPQIGVYVINRGINSILVFGPGASGGAAPAATLTGTQTALDAPLSVAVSLNLIALNGGTSSITEYGPVFGDTAPVLTIAGSQAGLSGASAVAIDPGSLRTYAVNAANNSLSTFTYLQSGNASPTLVVQGSNTKINQPSSMAIDPSASIWITNAGDGSIEAFSFNSSGNVAPQYYIAGPSTTLTPGITGISANENPSGVGGSAVTIYVCNTLANSIVGFQLGATGNVAPAVTISGSSTGLNAPDAVYAAGSKIYVANSGNASITIYPVGSSGNVAPVATIAGPATGITDPIGLAGNFSIYSSSAGGVGSSLRVRRARARFAGDFP